jgi:hypothetical protein
LTASSLAESTVRDAVTGRIARRRAALEYVPYHVNDIIDVSSVETIDIPDIE